MKAGFDEMNAAPGVVRAHYHGYEQWLAQQPPDAMQSVSKPKVHEPSSKQHAPGCSHAAAAHSTLSPW